MQHDNKYAIFIECSQSVKSKGHYWDVVGSLIKNKEINRYFFFGNTIREVDYDRVKDAQKYLRGWGNTDTSVVARKIVQQKLTHVFVITASQVKKDVVRQTDDVFEAAKNKFKIQSSICYIICDHYINFSSICPFTRYGRSVIYQKFKNSEMRLIFQHKELEHESQLQTLSYINLNNFQINFAGLQKYIINQNMGKAGFPFMKEQLLFLRKKLVHELSVKKTEEDYSKMIRLCLEESNTQAALEYAQKMTYEYMSYEYSMEIEQKIAYLVSLCGDLSNSFDINQIQTNKLKFAVEVKQGELINNVEIAKLTTNIIECPIIMDEDVPQILVDAGEPVLLGFDKKIVDDIAACPLRILNYPEVKAKLKSRISHFIGTKLNGKLFINPFTRNKVLGAIPLGCHESHVEVGDNTIAQLISGGKYLGNLSLYYAVVWYLINEGQIEYLKPIKQNASEHLAYRLRNSFTTASMCGLPQFVTTRVTTDVAIWYIVNSGYFNLPTNRDVFRYHIFNMEPMVKILRVLKYPLHKGVKEHFFRTRAMLKMLFKLKKYNPNFQKGFHTIFKGFYQKGFFVDITNVSIDFWQREVCAMFIPIDGAADNEQIARIRDIIPKCCKYLSNEQIYFLSHMLDASKSASDIYLDYNVVIPPLPKAEINWCYGLKEQFNAKTEICPATMRPYLKVKGVPWQLLARKAYQVQEVDDLWSGHRSFGRFVAKYKRIPLSVDELAIFFYNRFIYSGKEKTLPYLTQKWTKELLINYGQAADKQNQYKTIKDLVFLFNLQHIGSIEAFEETWLNSHK